MKQIEILAVLEALAKIVLNHLKSGELNYGVPEVYDLFSRYASIRDTLIKEYTVFNNLPCRKEPEICGIDQGGRISRSDLDMLRSDIGYCHQVLSKIEADHVAGEHKNPYIDIKRIEELERISNDKFNLMMLIEFCKELNRCHSVGAILAIPLLVRSILDHVPPIFSQKTFIEVANNYGFTKSNKGLILKLQESSRKIADSYLHTQIRKKEALPTRTQVDFKNDLDVLLQEIVRILKD